MDKMSLKEIVFALVESIDLVNYLLKNHHRRVAIIAYELGKMMSLDDETLQRIVLAAAFHDIGALYVKERDDLIRLDIENPHPHAIRGALLLKEFNYFEDISDIVLHHHRYWDYGRGSMFMSQEVPIESFIIHLADRIEILYDITQNYFIQIGNITKEILEREGKIFSPECVSVFLKLSKLESFWLDLETISFNQLLHEVFEDKEDIEVDLEAIEHIARLFSSIVDTRSNYTASHSKAVGAVAYELCQLCKMDEVICKKLRIAGLLHDLGKIAIPNEIIEKESKLTDEEFQVMKSHAYYTNQILKQLVGLDDICKWASMHHEKRDGLGYPFHIDNDEFTIEIDILALADVFTALSENRPYRDGMSNEKIFELISEEFKARIKPEVLKVMTDNIDMFNNIREITQLKSYSLYNQNLKKISHLTDQLNSIH